MIDGNAIFDEHGVANIGKGIILVRSRSGEYELWGSDDDHVLSKNEVYNLGLALVRLSEAKKDE